MGCARGRAERGRWCVGGRSVCRRPACRHAETAEGGEQLTLASTQQPKSTRGARSGGGAGAHAPRLVERQLQWLEGVAGLSTDRAASAGGVAPEGDAPCAVHAGVSGRNPGPVASAATAVERTTAHGVVCGPASLQLLCVLLASVGLHSPGGAGGCRGRSSACWASPKVLLWAGCCAQIACSRCWGSSPRCAFRPTRRHAIDCVAARVPGIIVHLFRACLSPTRRRPAPQAPPFEKKPRKPSLTQPWAGCHPMCRAAIGDSRDGLRVRRQPRGVSQPPHPRSRVYQARKREAVSVSRTSG